MYLMVQYKDKNVKIHLIVEQKNVDKVKAKLKDLDFVKDIIVNTPGEGTILTEDHLF